MAYRVSLAFLVCRERKENLVNRAYQAVKAKEVFRVHQVRLVILVRKAMKAFLVYPEWLDSRAMEVSQDSRVVPVRWVFLAFVESKANQVGQDYRAYLAKRVDLVSTAFLEPRAIAAFLAYPAALA